MSSRDHDRRAILHAPTREDLRGHTYGNTVLQDQATAHFGDTNIIYNIQTGNDSSESTRSQPLTVSKSVAGLLAASAQAIEIITNSSNTTPSVREIQLELTGLRIIISGLNAFIDRTSSISVARAALVPVQDVITVLTQLVLVFAELENVLERLSADTSRGLSMFSLRARRNDNAVATRLLNQLLRHKMSLSLILQIIQW